MYKLDFRGESYKLLEPSAYQLLLLTDWSKSLKPDSKFNSNSFAAFYLIYLCLETVEGIELSEKTDFMTFIKTLKPDHMRGLDAAIKSFQDLLTDPDAIEKSKADNG